MENVTRAHQLGAIVVTAVVLACTMTVIFYPFSYLNKTLQDRTQDVQFQIDRLKKIPLLAAQPSGQLSSESENLSGPFFTVGNRELAFADLQKTIRQIARKHGAEIHSTTTMHSKSDDRIAEVRIAARLSVGIAGLRDIVRALEATDRRLFIENMSVNQRFGARSQNQTNENRLEFRFEAVGYFDAAKSGDAA